METPLSPKAKAFLRWYKIAKQGKEGYCCTCGRRTTWYWDVDHDGKVLIHCCSPDCWVTPHDWSRHIPTERLQHPVTWEGAVYAIAGEMVETLLERHQKYGPLGHSILGLQGIAVRLVDKALRLWNGLEDVLDESVEDTLTDTGNYAIIGKMLKRGWWGLPQRRQD